MCKRQHLGLEKCFHLAFEHALHYIEDVGTAHHGPESDTSWETAIHFYGRPR